MKLNLFMLVVVGAILCSCSKKQAGADVIPEETFVRFYADKLIMKEECVLLHSDSSTVQHRMDSLYQAYHTTPAQVQATVSDYKTDVMRWRDFYQKVDMRLDTLQRQASNHKTGETDR
jgi:hypothetical protein